MLISSIIRFDNIFQYFELILHFQSCYMFEHIYHLNKFYISIIQINRQGLSNAVSYTILLHHPLPKSVVKAILWWYSLNLLRTSILTQTNEFVFGICIKAMSKLIFTSGRIYCTCPPKQLKRLFSFSVAIVYDQYIKWYPLGALQGVWSPPCLFTPHGYHDNQYYDYGSRFPD